MHAGAIVSAGSFIQRSPIGQSRVDTITVMVSVSQETIEKAERRLRVVIAAADLVVFDGMWAF